MSDRLSIELCLFTFFNLVFFRYHISHIYIYITGVLVESGRVYYYGLFSAQSRVYYCLSLCRIFYISAFFASTITAFFVSFITAPLRGFKLRPQYKGPPLVSLQARIIYSSPFQFFLYSYSNCRGEEYIYIDFWFR